jgi:hypothetical protein
MSLKPLLKSFLVLGFCTFTACNQYSDSLMGEYQNTSKCPANGCANQAASANSLKLSNSSSAVTLYPASTDTKVEISGDCSFSTYPSNKINVSVVTQTGNTPMNAPAYSVTGSSTQPACRKGKFDVMLDIRSLPASTIYTVKMELVAYDASNVPYTNAAGGYLYLNLVR